MKSYLITTALVFAGISVVHLWRFAAEGPRLASEPDFMITSILSVALVVWAVRLLLRRP